jgi:hypothetical protein
VVSQRPANRSMGWLDAHSKTHDSILFADYAPGGWGHCGSGIPLLCKGIDQILAFLVTSQRDRRRLNQAAWLAFANSGARSREAAAPPKKRDEPRCNSQM